MTAMSSDLREQVVQRAGNRCEYCRLSQAGQEAAFHIDHIVPQSAGGQSSLDNLALACVSCSLRKWARTSVVDPTSGEEVPFFNPRTQSWTEHFHWQAETIIPLTAIGRATVAALALNRSLIIAIRHEETTRGRHPPESHSE